MRNINNILTIFLLLTFLTSCDFSLTESKPLKEWTIEEYKVTYARKLGPVGPHYYQYDVYKNDEYLSYGAFHINNDSCLLRYRERNDYYVDFNLCDLTKRILQPDKEKIDLNSIDSILIRPYDSLRLVPSGKKYPEPFYDTIITRNFDSTLTKKLNRKEINIFVKKWNKSSVNGFDRLGKTYDYLITVHSKKSIRKIKTLNNYMTENEKWSFETKDDEFFKGLWNEKE